MKHLIDKKKFLEELAYTKEPYLVESYFDVVKRLLSKHVEDIKDEPHHSSGMDHHDINVRNALRKELRGGD